MVQETKLVGVWDLQDKSYRILKEFQLQNLLVQLYKELARLLSYKVNGATNLQHFHLARLLVQEDSKIFILQGYWCRKLARF